MSVAALVVADDVTGAAYGLERLLRLRYRPSYWMKGLDLRSAPMVLLGP